MADDEIARALATTLAEELTDTVIAQNFHITEQQLDAFVSRIKQKTGLQSRAELVQLGRSINRLVEE